MKTRLVWLTLALALPSGLEAHKPTKTRFTYHKDVFPIFERRCGSCHREGGAGPMSLLRYKDTFPWAVSIKNQVLALSMPPWFARRWLRCSARRRACRHRSCRGCGW